MHRKGINYDVGTLTVSKDTSSRETFDPLIVQREIDIIKNALHCTAIRISGQDITRLLLASEYALRQGLEVWFSPRWIDATEQEMLTYLAQCAQVAEQLRQQSPHVIFVVGCELTFFLQGLVDGNTALERMKTFMKPWRLLKSTLVKGPFNTRLNAFLAQATAIVREGFHGQLTYASGPWEAVDWVPFDFVGIDYYRDARNTSSYRQALRKYFTHGKPVVILEFGCCTYQGAEEKGGYGWAIVNRNTTPNRAVAKSSSPLSDQSSKGFVKMRGECASGMSDIAFALTCKKSKHGVVEDGEHLRGMSHTELCMVFAHGSIASIMQSIFDAPMSSGQVE